MKKLSLYVPVYSLTLLLSAALLFSVQPMFSKMILPLLGGAPQVWNTAMLFFQVMLLGGYAYAHGTTKYLSVRAQAVLHLVLLSVFLMALPFGIPAGWSPPADHDPTLWQLALMATTVGGPFFVLAGSAPMFQRWFSETDHPDSGNPYFLYGASNLGSMTALLAYPTIIEPLLNLHSQAHAWMTGYIALVLCTLMSAGLAWNHVKKKTRVMRKKEKPIAWRLRLRWLVLAFVPSSLMLGVTTFITTDIGSMPLLWIVPLALYVGTFIIAFAKNPPLPRHFIITAQGTLMILLLAKMIAAFSIEFAWLMIAMHMLLFFFSALACHTELARSRPGASHITEFYLIMSLGGALGGFFNAIIAPVYLVIPVEYALALAAAVILRFCTDEDQSLAVTLAHIKKIIRKKGLDSIFALKPLLLFLIFFAAAFSFSVLPGYVHLISAALVAGCMLFLLNDRWAFALAACMVLMFYTPGYEWGNFIFTKIIHRERNFFGVMKVVETKFGERILLHGTTNHGAQALDPKYRLTPLSYYSSRSPLNDAFAVMDQKPGPQKIAVIGLGVGVTACFHRPGRHFDFFEIDPDVVSIAENPNYFTFLKDCGSPYNIVLGDGRLTMQKKPDQTYDMIVLDAFSSDNIPMHLLTKEAVAMYRQKLKPGGLLVFHISNNYLDIEPELTKIAEEQHVPGYAKLALGGPVKGTPIISYAAHYFVMTDNRTDLAILEQRGWTPGRARKGVGTWSDQFSNILSVFINRTGLGRYREIKSGAKPSKLFGR